MARVGMIASGVLAVLIASSAAAEDKFDIRAPTIEGTVKPLWATRYYVHYLTPVTDSHASPLLHRNGKPSGILISNYDFCFGALQGTIGIRTGRQTAVYNVDGLVPRPLATCTFGGGTKPETNERLGRQAWVKLSGNGIYGLGARGWRLISYRTIAVDPSAIPLGSVFFIPKLRGVRFDDNGVKRVHDGYVIAGDVGKSVTGNHVDFFTGNFTGAAPPFVTSQSSDLFEAQAVTDPSVVQRLRAELRYVP